MGADTDVDDGVYEDSEIFGWGYDDSDTTDTADLSENAKEEYYAEDADTDSEYGPSQGVKDSDFEQYLYQYFNGDSEYNGEYYDDTELYFDNAEIEGDYGDIGEADTDIDDSVMGDSDLDADDV